MPRKFLVETQFILGYHLSTQSFRGAQAKYKFYLNSILSFCLNLVLDDSNYDRFVQAYIRQNYNKLIDSEAIRECKASSSEQIEVYSNIYINKISFVRFIS